MDMDIIFILAFWSFLSTIVAGITEWPTGLYALPKPLIGCPGSSELWETKSLYFNMTSSMGETVLVVGKETHFSIEIERDFIRFDVCSRINTNLIQEIKEEQTESWPKGQYCILHIQQINTGESRTEPSIASTVTSRTHAQTCPNGFTQGYLPWPYTVSSSTEGVGAPHGNLDSSTKYRSCCRESVDGIGELEFPNKTPFYIQQARSKCPQVKGMNVETEYLEWKYTNNSRSTENATSDLVETGKYTKDKYCYYSPYIGTSEGTYAVDNVPNGYVRLVTLNTTQETPDFESVTDQSKPPDYTNIKIAVGVVVIGTPGITLLVLCICRARNIHMKKKFLTRDSYRMTSFTYQSSFTTRRYSNSPPSSDNMVEKPQKEFTYKFQNHRLRIENPAAECEV